MKITPLLVVSLLLSLSPATHVGYENWEFSYTGDWGNITMGDGVSITISNGVAYFRGSLGNVSQGAMITLNLTASVSPESVEAGIKIVLGDDTAVESELKSGNYSFQMHAEGDEMLIVLYDYGGNMTVDLENLWVEEPKEGLSEGLVLTGVGITVVFLVLGILAGVMYLLKPRRKEVKNMERKIEPQGNEISGVEPEVVAAITGALSLYLGGKKFRIISVKESPWKYYGRLKNMRR